VLATVRMIRLKVLQFEQNQFGLFGQPSCICMESKLRQVDLQDCYNEVAFAFFNHWRMRTIIRVRKDILAKEIFQ